MSSPIERFEDILKSKDAEIERLTAQLKATEANEQVLVDANKPLLVRIAELESDDHEWYLQAARIEKLKGDIQVLKLQRDATHVSRCPVCKETNDE